MSITVNTTSDSNENKSANLAGVNSSSSQSASGKSQDETTEVSETTETDQNESEDHESLESKQDDQDENESAESADQARKKDENKGIRKRVAKFQKELSKKDQEIEIWKAEALKARNLKEAPTETQQDAKTDTDGEPDPDNFDSHREYIKAVSKWTLDQDKKEQAKVAKQTAAKSEFDKTLEVHQSRVDEFKKVQTDYVQVLEDFIEDHGDIKFSVALEESILSSDLGPAIIYELAKNPSELDRINSLGAIAAAREIGKLEAKLAKSAVISQEKTEIKTTKAPAPLSPVSGKGTGTVAKSLADPTISFADFERIRRQQLQKR